jgi:hypothetical protein
MKQYLREQKKWVSEEEYKEFHRKDHLCKGKKLHDLVLVLPDYVKYDDNYKFNPEIYYETMDKISEFYTAQVKFLKQNGIIISDYYHSSHRMYMCSVCKKRKYE